MSVSKADVCTLYVDGVTKPWKQDPLELKDGTPIQGGTQLPFSSTKEGRQELKTFLNDLNPLWQWNYRGGSSYFPGTRVIRNDYLRCHFAGEVRKKHGRRAGSLPSEQRDVGAKPALTSYGRQLAPFIVWST
jgi:hypothetical protein